MSGIRRRGRRVPGLNEQWRAALDDYVQAVAWSPGGGMLAAASISGPITIFDAHTGTPRAVLPGHGLGTTALSWHPDGDRLLSAGQDGTARVWDAHSGQALFEVDGGVAWVENAAWSPAGDLFATIAGRTLRLWSASGSLLRQHAGHDSTLADLQWRPGGRELAIVRYGGLVLYHADDPSYARPLEWKGSSLVLAWSNDGRYIATGDQDATVHFWNVPSGEDLQMWGYESKVLELAWDHQSRFLATGGSAHAVVWDCSGTGPAGSKPLMLRHHAAPISALMFQHRGNLLASGGDDGVIAIWPVGHSNRPASRARLGGAISRLTWSADDTLLAAGDENGTVAVFVNN